MSKNFSATLRAMARSAEAMAELNERHTREEAEHHAEQDRTKVRGLVETFRHLANGRPQETGALNFSDLIPAGRIAQIQRALTAGIFPDGGALVPTEIFAVAEALRPQSVIVRAGAQIATVAADQQVPAIESGAVAQWVSETGEVTETSVILGSLGLAPKRCGALLKVSQQLLAQAPTIAAAVLRRDLLGAIGQSLDVASFSGVGGVEPIGICNNDNILKPVTFGGAPTLLDACNFEQALADVHAEQGALAFIASPTVRNKWRNTEGLAGSGVPLWNGNEIIGKPALATATVTGNTMLYGNWEDFLLCFFGSQFTVISDPYSSKKSAVHEFYVELRADCGPMRRKSFARSTDSAAQ